MKKAFTLVELIVVITILAILGTISFISLQGYSKDTRDVKRISDVRSLLSKVNIENTAGTPLSNLVTNDETATGQILGIANTQFQTMGEINFINLNENPNDFQDPISKTNYPVAYAIGGTGSGVYNFTQIATISETQDSTKILGNYYTQEQNDIPSLFTEDGTNYYSEGGEVIYDINDGTTQQNPPTPPEEPPITTSCNETTKPTDNGNIIYTEGTPIEENQSWQNTDANNACYYTCKPNYTGTNCSEEILNGTCNTTNTPIATAPTTENLCISGTSTTPQDNTTNWSWTCEGANGGTTANCIRAKAYCNTTIPTGTGIEETIVGTPISTNQSWQNTNPSNACYYTCKQYYSGNNCATYIPPPNGPSEGIEQTGQLPDGSNFTWKDLTFSYNGTSYILMDRNLGATAPYSGTESSVVRGSYYQWGRNNRLWTNGSSSLNYDWQARNDNAWNVGGAGTDEARQGPCPAGYHVPTTLEWDGLIKLWFSYRLASCSTSVVSWCPWSGNATPTNLKSDLKIPLAGSLIWNSGTLYNPGERGDGNYWSSSPSGTTAHALFFFYSRVVPQESYSRAAGLSVRCFKN